MMIQLSIILVLDDWVTFATVPEAGAISTFSGTTRNNFNNKEVTKLEYEAYTEMAIKEMKRICKTIRERWNDIFKVLVVLSHCCCYYYYLMT